MTGDAVFTAFITKYALTNGIQPMKVEQSSTSPDMVNAAGNRLFTFHGEGKDWHRTLESAVRRAEEMRINKIKSVEKQLKRLHSMKFGD